MADAPVYRSKKYTDEDEFENAVRGLSPESRRKIFSPAVPTPTPTPRPTPTPPPEDTEQPASWLDALREAGKAGLSYGNEFGDRVKKLFGKK